MFQNLDITTTLSVHPAMPMAHDIIVITRGASASLAFNFTEKVYDFQYADQMTFIFKQGKNLIGYRMFEYLKPTDDTTPDPNKIYYANVTPVMAGGFQCTGTRVLQPDGDLSTQQLYEVTNDVGSWRDTLYILDEHFYHAAGVGYDYVTLTLSPEETKQFKPTTPDSNIPWEVAIRLNTDIFASSNYRDSIIVEPQHPLAVVDSLYSYIGG